MRKKKEPTTINFECPAKAEYVSITRSLSAMLAKNAGFTKEEQEDLIIATGEACVNVIRHAYKGNYFDMNMLIIRYLIYPERLIVIVSDYGRGFDPQFVQRYIKRTDIGKPEKVGLGIFLIKTLMDEVEYYSSIDKGTQVRMTAYKNIQSVNK